MIRTGIAFAVSTPVVHFTTGISFGHVDLGEVSNTGDLNVFRGFHEVNTLESAVGHGTRAATRFSAVSNCFTFSVTDRCKAG